MPKSEGHDGHLLTMAHMVMVVLVLLALFYQYQTISALKEDIQGFDSHIMDIKTNVETKQAQMSEMRKAMDKLNQSIADLNEGGKELRKKLAECKGEEIPKETPSMNLDFDEYFLGPLSGQHGWQGTRGVNAMDIVEMDIGGQQHKVLMLNDPKFNNMYHVLSFPAKERVTIAARMMKGEGRGGLTIYIKDGQEDMGEIALVEDSFSANSGKGRADFGVAKPGSWHDVSVTVDCEADEVSSATLDGKTVKEHLPLASGRECEKIDNIRLVWNVERTADIWIRSIKIE